MNIIHIVHMVQLWEIGQSLDKTTKIRVSFCSFSYLCFLDCGDYNCLT